MVSPLMKSGSDVARSPIAHLPERPSVVIPASVAVASMSALRGVALVPAIGRTSLFRLLLLSLLALIEQALLTLGLGIERLALGLMAARDLVLIRRPCRRMHLGLLFSIQALAFRL